MIISFLTIYWDPNPVALQIEFLNLRIFWYGILFALGFAFGFPIFVSILNRYLGGGEKKKAIKIADRLTLYMILGTVIGARVGHFLFYERPGQYHKIFRIWEGGLASHGAAVGIILALILFTVRYKGPPKLTWIRLLDFIAPAAALGGALIRIGNFINQEILGSESNLPWAVVFGHPADGSLRVPRHPVQIYEACFYFLTFVILFKLSQNEKILKKEGKLIGLFLILVFGFRFFIEFIKPEQSHVFFTEVLNMGQVLSIPITLLGVYLFCKKNLQK